MKITTVSYTKTFNLGNYCSEKVGVEVEINEGDNVEHGLDAAKKLVEDFHRKNNPQLYENIIQEVPIMQELKSRLNIGAQQEEQFVTKDDSFLFCINNATSLKELSIYKPTADKNQSLKLAYLAKEKELTDGKH